MNLHLDDKIAIVSNQAMPRPGLSAQVIEKALGQAGASLRDVVRTRIFVTDISRLDEAARAHGEAFGEIRPAATMVEVSRLADVEMLVEIEAVAVV